MVYHIDFNEKLQMEGEKIKKEAKKKLETKYYEIIEEIDIWMKEEIESNNKIKNKELNNNSYNNYSKKIYFENKIKAAEEYIEMLEQLKKTYEEIKEF